MVSLFSLWVDNTHSITKTLIPINKKFKLLTVRMTKR